MDFSNIDAARAAVKELLKSGETVRLDLIMQRPRLELRCAAATIKGAYPHMFRVEVATDECVKTYSVQYSELVTGKVRIYKTST